MIGRSTKALATVVTVTAAILMKVSCGFSPVQLVSTSNNNGIYVTTTSSLSLLDNSADWSSLVSGSSSSSSSSSNSSSDIPNIAPPPMMMPPSQPEEANAFFASPSDDPSMDIEMSSSSSSSSSLSSFSQQPSVALASTSPSKKMVKFQTDGGIMMEFNRPYPSVRTVTTTLSWGQKKAQFRPEGIMMAATSSVPKPKKSKSSSSSPKESSSTQPNASSFRWKPAAVTPNGKLQWQQREIDCMPMPAE
jgi:hypothetical protein